MPFRYRKEVTYGNATELEKDCQLCSVIQTSLLERAKDSTIEYGAKEALGQVVVIESRGLEPSYKLWDFHKNEFGELGLRFLHSGSMHMWVTHGSLVVDKFSFNFWTDQSKNGPTPGKGKANSARATPTT